MEQHTRDGPHDIAARGAEPVQRLDRSAGFPYTPGEYLRRFCWKFVQATAFRWSPARAFGWRKWLLRRFGAKLTGKVFVRPTTTVIHPWLLEMDDSSVLADGVTAYNLGPIR